MQDEKDIVTATPEVERVSNVQSHEGDIKAAVADKIHQEHPEFYLEALATYPDDEHIDSEAERRLKRKLDWRILPLLGVCYFFYVLSTPLSLALASSSSRIADLPNSMSTRQPFPMRPSSASRTRCTCTGNNTVGFQVSSISVGCSGRFRPILSCNGAHRPGISPVTSLCGVCC